ncbi:MAG: enoyl-CoA hydratase/isomerase family protein [Saccharolobus sp.]|uniref:Enoyl-CoA hydratase n=2 Tax=Saccharolobus shibatae TaxID=2286 RepID=A0A8F5BL74_SACSH|nr:enoyl-CoA hydratase/isomerase family protein [Saccharolobus shibatae]MCH4814260.1 enoyl-CoA hydratase/isomerase family protein [Saccharolobus shibatae]QXJ27333.1 putative enoyl-CoA hydratase [Saccharolobus shibatae B12]QXJ30641.1 putative enoyl-CoA hydratase [Saccharolobus shibatae]QXJ33669.1 putative enoyl-CoA hydratase [Saccharolobus shibatae]
MPIEVYEYDKYILLKFYQNDNKYNLFNVEFMTQMIDTLSAINDNKGKRFLIIRGEDNFGTGADIRELIKASNDSEFAITFFTYMREIFHKMLDMNKIVISQVKKIAYGASMELLLLSDYVISESKAMFATPGVKIGVFPPVLSSIGHFILGYNNVKRIAMKGEVIDANEAKSIGLVHIVNDDLDKATFELIKELSISAPSATLYIKRNMLRPFRDYIDKAFNDLIIQIQSEEAREGLLSFLNKTNPPWF